MPTNTEFRLKLLYKHYNNDIINKYQKYTGSYDHYKI